MDTKHIARASPPNDGGGALFMPWVHYQLKVHPVSKSLLMGSRSCLCTRNHPQGIKGAEATASAIFMARNGSVRDEIKKEPSHLKCNGSSSYLKNVCIVIVNPHEKEYHRPIVRRQLHCLSGCQCWLSRLF